jgi:DNA-binding IclR family transcriptional regulator
MILTDERINIDLYMAEDPRRFEVLKALDFEKRMSVREISRKIGFFVEETENALKDIEAVGLADTKEELKNGKLTFMARLSTRGLAYLREKGIIEEEEPEEPEVAKETAETGEPAEAEKGEQAA